MKYFLNYVALIIIFAAFGIFAVSAQTQKLTVANLKGNDYLGCILGVLLHFLNVN